MSTSFEQAAEQLCRAGELMYRLGWLPANSSNFSARLDDGSLAVTVSGNNKGALTLDDIMRVDLDGAPLTPGKRPSNETLLHAQLYRHDPAIGAVLHVHSLHATVVSRLATERVELADYELLKAFAHIDTHATRVVLPVFDNDQDIPRLTTVVQRWLDAAQHPVAYLIRGHGIYSWGASVDAARCHLEAIDMMLGCELEMLRLESH